MNHVGLRKPRRMCRLVMMAVTIANAVHYRGYLDNDLSKLNMTSASKAKKVLNRLEFVMLFS